MKINFNMKRITATILAGFVLAGSYPENVKASSDIEGYLSNVSVINQREERFQTRDYRYMSHYFGENGCGPASISNALLALFNVTDSDTAFTFTEEVMRLVCDFHDKDNVATIDSLVLLDLDLKSYLKDKKEKYPVLYNLVSNYSGDIMYLNSRLTNDKLIEHLESDNSNDSYTYMYKFSMQDKWDYIIDIVNTLYKYEKYDTNLIFARIASGTRGTNAPFRSGDGGHYVTFAINVKDFYENGTIYMLDSLARALENEKIGEGSRYKKYYDFVTNKNTFKEFNDIYNVTRVSDNVLKIGLTETKLATVHNLLVSDANSLLDDYRMMLLEPFITYGTGMTFLTIPGEENVKTK